MIKLGADFYYGNEIMVVAHTIFFAGVSDAGLFGEKDPATGLYNRKTTLPFAEPYAKGLERMPLPNDTIDLFKATIGEGRIEKVE